MELLGNQCFELPDIKIKIEPDDFELFIQKVQQFSAQNFLEKAEQATISTQSEQFIQNSVSNSQELISETLADLLAKQGKIKQAIKMYQKLAAIQPEKNNTFQSKIHQLKL